MRTRLKRKLQHNKGFTQAEMLLAMLILLMVSAIVATGIPVAKNAYERVVRASNAEVLMSTSISALRNELGTAKDIEVTDAGLTYYNSARESSALINLGNGGKDIMLQRYYSADGLSKGSDPIYLVSFETGIGDTKDWHVKYGGVSYDEQKGIIKFSNLTVSWKDTTIINRETISIRVITGGVT